VLSVAVQVVSIALAATFAWAALAKVVGWRRWMDALARYRLGRGLRSFASVGVPASEAVACALLFGGAPKAGAAVVIALVAAFSLAVVRAPVSRDGDAPCGCFGGAEVGGLRRVLGRNAALAAAAAFLLLAGGDGTSPAAAGPALLPVVLVAVGVIVMAWLLWQTSASLRRR
jgi:hypothetical protein